MLGPVLWNLNYDVLLEAIDAEPGGCFVAYADDLVVLESEKSRLDLEKRLQRKVDVVVEATKKLNLKLSVAKTEAIILKGKLDRLRPPVVKLQGKSIKFVDKCKYLGVYLDRGLSF